MMGSIYLHRTTECKIVSFFLLDMPIVFRPWWGPHILPSFGPHDGPHLHHYFMQFFPCKLNAIGNLMIIILGIIRAPFIGFFSILFNHHYNFFSFCEVGAPQGVGALGTCLCCLGHNPPLFINVKLCGKPRTCNVNDISPGDCTLCKGEDNASQWMHSQKKSNLIILWVHVYVSVNKYYSYYPIPLIAIYRGRHIPRCSRWPMLLSVNCPLDGRRLIRESPVRLESHLIFSVSA